MSSSKGNNGTDGGGAEGGHGNGDGGELACASVDAGNEVEGSGNSGGGSNNGGISLDDGCQFSTSQPISGGSGSGGVPRRRLVEEYCPSLMRSGGGGSGSSGVRKERPPTANDPESGRLTSGEGGGGWGWGWTGGVGGMQGGANLFALFGAKGGGGGLSGWCVSMCKRRFPSLLELCGCCLCCCAPGMCGPAPW
jgi:hypothetical protein